MSDRGETFVSEELRDTFGRKLNKVFRKGKWRLLLGVLMVCATERLFLDSLEINVLDYEANIKMGIIEITAKKYIEDYGYGAFIKVARVN